MDEQKASRLREELLTLTKWDRAFGVHDRVGHGARLRRLWEIIVELGHGATKDERTE